MRLLTFGRLRSITFAGHLISGDYVGGDDDDDDDDSGGLR